MPHVRSQTGLLAQGCAQHRSASSPAWLRGLSPNYSHAIVSRIAPMLHQCQEEPSGAQGTAAPASPTSRAYRGAVTPVTVPGWAGSPAAGPGSASRCFTSCFPPPPQCHRSGKEPPQEGQDLQNQTGEALLPLLFFHCALGSPAGLGCCCAGVQLCGRLGVRDHGRGAVPPP